MKSTIYQPSESLALVYLGAPVFLFFAMFVRYEVAIPAVLFLCFISYQLITRTKWSMSDVDFGSLTILFLIAAAWVFATGGLGVFYENRDWAKHHAILNLLAAQPWPANTIDGTLRYYLGWYLVPAFAIKYANGFGVNLFASFWSLVGLTIFFGLIAPQFKSRIAVIIGVIAFMIFSGADLIGYAITKFQVRNEMHFEWWSGWIEYSSNTTSLFWVQQHALPAWIGIALLLRQFGSNTKNKTLTLLFVFVGFWSPFAAIGLAPFALAMLPRFGIRETFQNWQSLFSILIIGLPVASYLLTDSAGLPHGLIWSNGCVTGGPCFSWIGLLTFLILEVGGAAFVMLFCKVNIPTSFLIAAFVTLCLIPFYRLGVYNDFAMRASIPAIAILALSCAHALTMTTWPRLAIPLLVLAIGVAVPLTEVYRGLYIPRPNFSANTFAKLLACRDDLKPQYFTKKHIWVLRTNLQN